MVRSRLAAPSPFLAGPLTTLGQLKHSWRVPWASSQGNTSPLRASSKKRRQRWSPGPLGWAALAAILGALLTLVLYLHSPLTAPPPGQGQLEAPPQEAAAAGDKQAARLLHAHEGEEAPGRRAQRRAAVCSARAGEPPNKARLALPRDSHACRRPGKHGPSSAAGSSAGGADPEAAAACAATAAPAARLGAGAAPTRAGAHRGVAAHSRGVRPCSQASQRHRPELGGS